MAGDDTIITDDIRAAGRAVLDRMATDTEYATRLVEDPVPLLVEAGIPEGVMPALAAGILDNAEVNGFGFVAAGGPHAPTVDAGTQVQTIGSGTSVIKQTNPTAFGNTDAFGRNYWYA